MLPGQFEVGQLYKNGLINGLPVFTQPGGPGTLVYPQYPTLFPAQNQGYYQQIMSYPALYYAGCGHGFNCFEVFEVYDPYGEQQVALLCCPFCSYIQAIYEPADDYWNYEVTPIVIG